MAAVHLMPLRGERGAPTFDKTEPNDLNRYFRQLETLFTRCTIADDEEMKLHAVTYVKADVAETWEALPEFTDDTKTFREFKERLFEIYNQVSTCYILSDLDHLIGEHQRIGMRSLQDLSEFHFSFNAVSTYLITNQLLSARERSQAYLHVFDEVLQGKILMRLQIVLPNQHPSLPYEIGAVYDAAKWVLQGVSGTVATPAYSVPVTAVPSAEAGFVKTEQLGAFLNDFKKSIVDALSTNRPRTQNQGFNGARSSKCMFDGCDAFIRDCPGVEEYIKQGKVRRNFEGKVIIGTGAFVPRDIPGEFLKDRVDEWHRRNPNQLIQGAISSNTTLFGAVVPNSTPVVPTPRVYTDAIPAYQLSAQDRISALEAELFNLRVRHQPGFVPTVQTRSQRAANRNQVKETVTKVQDKPRPARITEIIEDKEKTPKPIPATEPVVPLNEQTEHPFRSARDATYAPPTVRKDEQPKLGAQSTAKKDVAYRTLPVIHDSTIANAVYNRALESHFTITHRELLSLSPEVRSQLRDAVSSKRVPTKESAPVIQANILQDDDLSPLTNEELAYLFPDEDPVPYDVEHEPAPVLALSSLQCNHTLPDDAIIVNDEIDQYYRTLSPGQAPDPGRLIVAKESSALRAIIPLINNHLKVESILDPGCQIIAMSEDVCHELSLPYDPTIILHMQSANGTIDPSLGLARNVPFLIGALTFYMQVHVIRNPAYDVLLGRPFDVLMESVVRNFRNEDQTITLHDPNTMRVATVPTICRGPAKILSKKKSVFQK